MVFDIMVKRSGKAVGDESESATRGVIAGIDLIDAQAELPYHGIDVIEYVALHAFEFTPFGRIGEKIELEGQTHRCGIHLPHHHEHIVANPGM